MTEGYVNYEAALIWQIVERHGMKEVLRQKIDSSFFFGAAEKAAFIYLHTTYLDPSYNDTPSVQTFRRKFPHFPQVHIEEPIAMLCAHIRADVSYSEIGEILLAIQDASLQDPGNALRMAQQAFARMHSRHEVDNARTVVSLIQTVRENYLRMEANPTGLKGWALPWDALNQCTLGAQRGNLGCMYARPKRGKTHELVEIAACLNEQNVPGIIFTQELPVIEMCERYVASRTRVNYGKFLRGRLPKDQRDEFLENLALFAERPNVVIDRINGTEEDAAAEVFAKVEEHGAQWFCLDGAYKCASAGLGLLKLTAALKKGCLDKDVFGFLTSQAKSPKKGFGEGSGDDMAFGDALQIDCDWGIYISRDIEDMNNRRLTMMVPFIRNGVGTKFTVRFRLYEDMSQIEKLPFNEEETEDVVEADKNADEFVEAVTADFTNPDSTYEH